MNFFLMQNQEKSERILKWFIRTVYVLCVLLLVRFIQEEIAPYFPVMTDQGYYLKNAHQCWDYSKAHGYWNLLKAYFTHNKPALGFYPSSNLQMSLAASLIFPFLGANRVAALSIHIGSWLALLSLFACVLKKITTSWSWPAMGLGLLLSTSFGFVSAGGIADFRMEFPAACWTSIALLSWCWFLQQPEKRYAWAASFITFCLFTFRLISITYWSIPLALLLLYISLGSRICPRVKLKYAQLPIVALGISTLLLLFWNRFFIKEYYFGAFLAEVPLKSLHTSTWRALYYPKSLWENHFGLFACIELAAILIFQALLLLWTFLKQESRKVTQKVTIQSETLLFCFTLVLSAIVVLSLNPHQTPQHAGIVAPSLAISLIFLSLKLTPTHSFPIQRVGASLLLMLGFLFWQYQLLKSAPFQNQARREATTLNRVFESITTQMNRFEGIRKTALDMPNIVFLDWVEGFSHNSVFLYGREHLGYGNVMEMTVPRFIFALSRKELLKEIHSASIVVIPENLKTLANRPWPIMQSIRENFPVLTSEVRSTMTLAESFRYKGTRYELYFSPLGRFKTFETSKSNN